MAGNSFQDIRPAGGRGKRKPPRRFVAHHSSIAKKEKPKSIPRVSPVAGMSAANKHTKKKHWSSIHTPVFHKKSSADTRQEDGGRWALWTIAILALLSLIFSSTKLFAGATVTVTPKQEKNIINGVFTAQQDSDKTDSLSFEVMILADDIDTEIAAAEERFVERKAFGQIVVYNAYSSAPQRLIKNTRFETPDGKIYRIKKSVVVPGGTVQGGELVPGSLEVTVYADEPGEEYNIGLSDFTIPGFRDTARYESFYARSKTDITSGFSGTKRFPKEEDVAAARLELRAKLKDSLSAQARAQKPEGFTLYEDAIFITYGEEEMKESGNGKVRVTERATLHGVIFDTDKLARFIASQSLASFDGSAVSITNIDDIDFAIVDKENSSPLSGSLNVSFSGNIQVVWSLDEQALAKALAGVPKKQFQTVLTEFPYIEKAEATVRPFWQRTLPENYKDIRIEQIIE